MNLKMIFMEVCNIYTKGIVIKTAMLSASGL